ncbi:MAG: PQQ-dependent sugar dehydrogenase, partial [Rhodanobacteraceae bacterium]
MFIIQRCSDIVVVKNGAVLPTPFVTIPTACSSEQGILGLAFDPDYATNGTFYVTYTAPNSDPSLGSANDQVLKRFTVSAGDPDVADPNGEVILRVPDIEDTTTAAICISTARVISTGPWATAACKAIRTDSRNAPGARKPTTIRIAATPYRAVDRPTIFWARSSAWTCMRRPRPLRPTSAAQPQVSPRRTRFRPEIRSPMSDSIRKTAPRSSTGVSAIRSASASIARTATCSSVMLGRTRTRKSVIKPRAALVRISSGTHAKASTIIPAEARRAPVRPEAFRRSSTIRTTGAAPSSAVIATAARSSRCAVNTFSATRAAATST